MSAISLVAVHAENLRGYYRASLALTRPCTLLVGPNNSGKTSILRLLSWVLNDLDAELLAHRRALTPEEEAFLLPARDTRHRARRLALTLHVGDGRSWSRFQCDDAGFATLRLNVRLTPQRVVYLALGTPRRGESVETDDDAVELLSRLRKSIRFVHIPSFRDAKSDKFNTTLHAALRARITERALHAAQAGAPREHREVSKKLHELETLLLQLATPLWGDVRLRLPPGMARDAVLAFDCDQATFLNFLESRLTLRISTGDHDSLAVPIPELGSGLQSLLDLAFQDSEAPPKGVELIIAAEEPEAFLHPSAQRTVTSRLFQGAGRGRRVVVTTHSPIVVEEARFGDVTLCRDQKFYAPAEVSDIARAAINTALLNGFGAEMVFGSAVLFVEGEGDRQFFERLRRRIAKHDASGALDRCFVVPVGGNARFSPWLQLLSAYGDAGDRPIKCLIAADADAVPEMRKALRDGGLSVRHDVADAFAAITIARNDDDVAAWRRATRAANSACADAQLPLHFLELDLEEAALANAGDGLVQRISEEAGWTDAPTRDEMLRRMGAKGYGGQGGKKDVFLRGLAGELIHPKEVTPNALQCLRRWFAHVLEAANVNKLLRGWEA